MPDSIFIECAAFLHSIAETPEDKAFHKRQLDAALKEFSADLEREIKVLEVLTRDEPITWTGTYVVQMLTIRKPEHYGR